MSDALINKYRPQAWDEVMGHTGVVSSLQNALKKDTARAFLFTGGSGFGKTTLARLVAKEAGCRPGDIREIDAATHTGIDAMREVTSSLMYRPVGGGAVQAIVVDECQALSKQAWQSLLKVLEEPPPWVYWFLCTTEANKVPKTVQTRCLMYTLKPVSLYDLVTLLEKVRDEEKLKLAKGVLELCAREADGSPRQALSYLVATAAAEDLEEARGLLQSAEGSAEAVELARLLVKDAPWRDVQELLKKLREEDPEGVRRVVQAYLTTMILVAKSEDEAGRYLEKLDAFSQPFYTFGQLVMATGKALLSN